MKQMIPRIAVFSVLAGVTSLIACEDTPTAPEMTATVVGAAGTPMANQGVTHLPKDCTAGQTVTWDGSDFVCADLGRTALAHGFIRGKFAVPVAEGAHNVASVVRMVPGLYKVCLDPSIDLGAIVQTVLITPQFENRHASANWFGSPECIQVAINDGAGNRIDGNFGLVVFGP